MYANKFLCAIFTLMILMGCTTSQFDIQYPHPLEESVEGDVNDSEEGDVDDSEDGIKTDKPENVGVLNALKKAAQMRDVKWVAVGHNMPFNNGYFINNTTYSGIPYSSVLEYNQHVFLDVSLETFVTATHNPRSVLYTENISADNSKSSLGRVYHGLNCACYYGSTCSYLVVYALGIPFGIAATEFPKWDEMEVIDYQDAYGVKLADVLSSSGHVALVTDIKRYADGAISTITITENAGSTTSSKAFSPEQFNDYLSSGYRILRYKNIENNIQYTPLTDFVAVEDEVPGIYAFNDDICPNYGNKSNYVEGDVVVLNICSEYRNKGYSELMVYKNDVLLCSQRVDDIDIFLYGLSYGDYKVCLSDGFNIRSDYAYFKVVNMSVRIDSSSGNDIVYFSSANATPVYYDFCRESGNKGPGGVNGLLSHLFTPEELSMGRAELNSPLVLTDTHKYIKVHFENEYGRTMKTATKGLLN